jgi:hypothetical protein
MKIAIYGLLEKGQHQEVPRGGGAEGKTSRRQGRP